MKQYQPKEVKIKGFTFFISKFGAMTATMIFGDLVKTISPMISLITAFTDGLDTEINPQMVQTAFTAMDGQTLNHYIHTLLIDYENVMVEHDGTTEKLDEGIVDTLFEGQIDGIFSLMFEVLKENYASFFDSAASPFGKVLTRINQIVDVLEKSTEN